MRRIILTVLIGLMVPGCSPVTRTPAVTRAGPDRALDDLLVLIRQRLEVMHDVARYKWTRKAPIEDPIREQALLNDIEERGRGLGLDPEATRAFFAAQIEAAKLVQRADFHRWETVDGEPGGEAPDLAGVLRPRIDSLNRDLLASLARTQGKSRAATEIRSRANKLLTGHGIDAEVRNAAIQPLVQTVE